LAKRGRESRVAHFSPHDLRKTYASGLIDVSGDISTVSRLLGHASVNTTSIYDRRGEVAKRRGWLTRFICPTVAARARFAPLVGKINEHFFLRGVHEVDF
jgi:Phage integrase family